MDHQRESKEPSQADQAGEVRLEDLPKRTTRESRKEHTQADQAGEVRFGGFGPLSGQNGAPAREQGDRDRAEVKLARSVLDGFGLLSGQNGPPDERARSTAQADQASEARFGGFGPLSGQNGTPEGEQGAQPSRPSWRGPFWRIWAARSTAKLTKLARSVLEDLGC